MAFWPLDETSGTVAYDISGCGNHGTYNSPEPHNLLPLVGGLKESKQFASYGEKALLPTSKNYDGQEVGASFGTYNTSDNDFSIEFWIKPNMNEFNTVVNILKDVTYYDSRIGIYYYGGSISFGILTDVDPYYYEVTGYLNFHKKATHVVCVYSINSISIYIDGALADQKSLSSNFKFSNLGPDSITFKLGTENSSTYSYLANAIAIYRYALPYTAILSHYIEGNKQINPYQVSISNGGKFFDLNAAKLYESYIYTYPADKSLKSFINDTNTEYLQYNEVKGSLKLKDNAEVILEDFIMIPDGIGTTSKIEWRGNYGIKVETSVDGIAYEECVNGDIIPQYNTRSYDTSGFLYIKITMTALQYGDTLYTPEFSFLSIVFYRDKIIYSENGGGKLTLVDNSDATFGTLNYPTLSSHQNNGIKIHGGFKIDTDLLVNSVEMFFMPNYLNACTLFYASAGDIEYSWDSSGLVTKSNISKIYINGVEKASETDITQVFIPGYLYHIVLVLNNSATNTLYFNCDPNSLDFNPQNLYNNIILYEAGLDGSDIQNNYMLWTGQPTVMIVDPAIAIDEKTTKIDDVDWTVVQSS